VPVPVCQDPNRQLVLSYLPTGVGKTEFGKKHFAENLLILQSDGAYLI